MASDKTKKLQIIGTLYKDAVRFTEQDLTDEQKAQARENIGAPPIPQALTFKGATEATYDGSSAVTVEIPKTDSTLTVEGENADAKAVGDAVAAVDGRMSAAIKAIQESEGYAPEAEIVDARVGYDGTQHALVGDNIRSLGTDLVNLEASLKEFIGKSAADGLLYENDMLYLTSNGVVISEGVKIVSGSGGAGSAISVLKLVNEGESTFTVAEGSEVVLKFNFTSVDSEVATGNGTAKIIVNGATKATFSVPQGSNTVNVEGYLASGENTVKLTVTDIYGASRSLVYSVNVITLTVSSTFDDSEKFTGDITFKYTPVGLLDKTVYFVIDGSVYKTVDISASGKLNTIIFPAMPHGSHSLVVYCTAELNEATITSNRLVYDIICIEDGKTDTVISMPFEGGNYTAGDLISVPYTVYNPSSLTADVVISLVSDSGESLEYTYNVDRTKQTFTTREQPVGNVTLTITSGGVTKTAKLTVAELDIDVEAVTNDLELFLTSKGRSNAEYDPASWTYGKISTAFSGFNWVDNGWMKDTNGDTVLRVSGDARAVVGFTPFATDARQYGRTIELEYSVSDVANRDAVVISCLSGGKGFEATADKAYIKSEISTVNCRYAEDNRVRVTFVVEARSEYRLLSIYLNGILSGAVQYPDNDNFQQTTPLQISIGSNDCSVDIYTMRSYSTALSMDEIRDNLIADTADTNEKLRLYQENDIYDSHTQLSYDKLVKQLPTLIILGSLPTAKGDKKNVTVEYIDPDEPSLSFTDTATIDVQGTSSQYYIRKNWKIKTSEMHQPALDQLAAKVFCTKADYAEATGTHNTCIANFVHGLYDKKTPPQELDSKVRTTIYGHPCVIFHKASEEAEPVFIGKYNFNYDKGAENVFGFSKDYPLCECWEFCNNTAPTCLFHSAIGNSFGSDFEARYPDGKTESAAFRRVQAWVASTYQGGATSEALDAEYTDVDGNVHTHDTKVYRLAKFKTEFEDYFDPDFSCLYYVFTHVMLMADQRAKNMFLTTWDGVIWQPWFYDNDTCLGINNVGQLLYDYYHEDTDQLDGADIYSGQTSALWNNYREAFPDKIADLYCELRSSGKLTKDKVYDAFITNHADKWPISVYNEDADYKYVSMLRDSNDASNLGQIKGKGAEHLGYFVSNRLKYFDSKHYAPDYANNYISLRLYTPAEWAGVAPCADITVTPYSNMYAGVRYNANGELKQIRAEKNVPVTFKAPDETFTFTETAVYGASEISSIGDLSPLYAGFVKVEKATKLTELIIGSAVEGYVNYNLTEVSVGTNELLRKIDVRNCPNLTAPLDVSGCPNIEEIYCEGTGVTGVLPPASGYLRILHLPETVTNLTLRNQLELTDFVLPSYDSLSTLHIENVSDAIDPIAILNGMSDNGRVRIIGFDTEITESELKALLDKLDTMRGLDENGNNTDTAQVSGRIYVEMINGSLLKRAEKYVGLTVEYGSSYLVSTRLVERTLSGDYVNDRITSIGAYGIGALGGITKFTATRATSIKNQEYAGVPQRLILPKVTRIGSLIYCGTIKVLDTSSITNIDYTIFNGTTVTAFVLRGSTMTTLSCANLYWSGGIAHIYVPRALLSDDDETKDYRRATNWSNYADKFRALEDYTVDGTVTGELDETKI